MNPYGFLCPHILRKGLMKPNGFSLYLVLGAEGSSVDVNLQVPSLSGENPGANTIPHILRKG